MLKRTMLSVLTILVVFTTVFSTASFGQNLYIDQANANNGKVTVTYKSDKQLAAMVVKGNQKEQYILNGGNNSVPLQMGDGAYTVYVLEHVSGTSYKQVSKETVNVKIDNKNSVYLQSIQMIDFNNNMEAVKKAKELTKNAKNDREKVEAIYNYIVENVKYDKEKAVKVGTNYIPVIDNTFKSDSGICYDYASLFAGMLRSENIPTKLVMGRSTNVSEYHAWNEVYFADTNEWLIVDTTVDAGLLKGNKAVSMFKSVAEYSAENVY